VPSIKAYRDHAEAIGKEEIRKANQQLASGKAPEQVIETLTHNLINKLAHDPSVNLREAAVEGQAGLLEAVRTLFRFKDKTED